MIRPPNLGTCASNRATQDVTDEYDCSVFQMPWQRIVSSIDSLAHSHELLAQKIDADVERPLREYLSTNKDLQSMGNMQGNLGALSKDLENAQKKADKLKEKGAKAAAGKVANANASVEDANQQWESQAPFVFEQLQSVDENRLNHLRDVLTQYQTHEVDLVERNRVSAEDCLNILLNVETADEIKTFAARTTGGRPSIATRRSSRAAATGGPVQAPPTLVPASSREEDAASQRSDMGGQSRLAPRMWDNLNYIYLTDRC